MVIHSSFLRNFHNYCELHGVPPNLYKYFIVTSWRLISRGGVTGLLHPEGIFNDPKAGYFRKSYYQRLKSHYQFVNQLKMFSEIGNTREYGINISSSSSISVAFHAIFNLFHPKTIQSSLNDNHGTVSLPPGFKTSDSKWDVRGHNSRVLTVDDNVLNIFSKFLGIT